jgi:hypothetical protein
VVALPKRIDNWSLTSRQARLVKTGGRLIKHARYDCRCQWDEAETLTGADLVKKEIEDGVVVKVNSVLFSKADAYRSIPRELEM